MISPCVSQIYIAMTKAWDNQLKRRDLFWLIASEVSVHGQLALLHFVQWLEQAFSLTPLLE
jgi:hypothetical protein